MTPPVHTYPTTYEVTCLPGNNPGRRWLTIHVTACERDLWIITRRNEYLGRDGTWDYEPPAKSQRELATWRADHWLPLQEALELARAIAPTLTVNGHTVDQVLAMDPEAF